MFSGTCQFNNPAPINVIGANGHFYGCGTKFEMFSWNGTLIAVRDATLSDSVAVYRHDIVLQGKGETVFFQP